MGEGESEGEGEGENGDGDEHDEVLLKYGGTVSGDVRKVPGDFARTLAGDLDALRAQRRETAAAASAYRRWEAACALGDNVAAGEGEVWFQPDRFETQADTEARIAGDLATGTGSDGGGGGGGGGGGE